MSEPKTNPFLAVGEEVKDVTLANGMTAKIRPLSWRQETAIAGTVANLVKKGVPQEVADREYMKLTVVAGLVEPKMTEIEVEALTVGIVAALSSEIGKLSGGLQKK